MRNFTLRSFKQNLLQLNPLNLSLRNPTPRTESRKIPSCFAMNDCAFKMFVSFGLCLFVVCVCRTFFAKQRASSDTQNTPHRWTYPRHRPHPAWFPRGSDRRWPGRPCVRFGQSRWYQSWLPWRQRDFYERTAEIWELNAWAKDFIMFHCKHIICMSAESNTTVSL